MKKYSLLLLLSLLIIACKEEENLPDQEPTALKMIARSWRVQTVFIDEQEDDTGNYANYRFIFNADQTYRFLMPDEIGGYWELASNANLLILDRNTDQEQTVRILELIENALKLEFSVESEKTGLSLILCELAP